MENSFSTSVALVKQPPEFGKPGFDQVFLTAKVRAIAGGWRLDIDQDCPVVALNDKVKQGLDLDCPIINDVRAGKHPGLILFSAGSFVWIKEGESKRLYLLRRDLTAPSDPGLMTGPAGRCDKLIWATLAEESNEELLIVLRSKATGTCELVVFLKKNENEYYSQGNIIKSHQSRDFVDDLKKINPQNYWRTQPYKISDIMQTTGPRYKITTYVEGELAEEVEVNIAFLDEANRTLEIRNIFELEVPKGYELALIRDGEKLNREVVSFASLAEIPLDKTVPTLRHYIINSNTSSPVELLHR